MQRGGERRDSEKGAREGRGGGERTERRGRGHSERFKTQEGRVLEGRMRRRSGAGSLTIVAVVIVMMV